MANTRNLFIGIVGYIGHRSVSDSDQTDAIHFAEEFYSRIETEIASPHHVPAAIQYVIDKLEE